MTFRRLILGMISFALAAAFAMPVMAQQDQRGGGPPFDQRGGGRGGRGGQFDGSDRGGNPGGPGMRGGQGIEIAKYDALRSYIDVVDRYSKLAQDPEASAVAAVISASDLLRQQGPDAAIEYFTKMLPQVKPAVERAIRIQLADLYKQKHDVAKAMEQYEILMIGKALPATAATPAPQPQAAQGFQPTVQPGGPSSPGGSPTPPPRPAQ